MSKFNLFIENLYHFHFRQWKGQVVVYALTFVIALLWAIINALVLGRSEHSVVLESIVLTVIFLVGLPIVYVTAVIKPQARDASEDESFNVASHLRSSRHATSWASTSEIREDGQIRPIVRLKEKIEAALTTDSHNRERPTATTQEPRPRETSMSNEELMLAVKYDDNQDAFRDLYLLHFGRSLAICHKSNASEADDLNQKAWMRVWARREKFRDDEKFIAFLIVITMSVCIEDYRARQRRKEVQGDETDERWLDWLVHQAERPHSLAEFSEKFQRAWGHLSEEEQEMLQQEYVDKRLRKDIASEWGISAPTLRTRIERVRDLFKKHLLGEGITLREDN